MLMGFLILNICEALRDLVPSVQFRKRENTHGGVLLLVLKVTLLLGCFSRFLDSANGTRLRNASQILHFFSSVFIVDFKQVNVSWE